MTLSAFLLFLVEPMVGKMLLPYAGGAAAVWTTSLIFFQLVLLAGYAWAHLVVSRLAPRLQVAVQVALLVLAVISLPIGFSGIATPPGGANPVPWLLLALLVRVGLPFFCLSSLSPVLQSWFARSGHRRAPDPYFLYASSNLGSLVALAAYPSLVERFLGLAAQARIWAGVYGVLVALVLLAGVRVWKAGRISPAPGPTGTARVRGRQVALWMTLAAVPSLWLVAVTTFFTSEIRPIPLLWVIPLALYLLSFVVVFGRRTPPTARLLPAYPFFAVFTLALALLPLGAVPFLWSAAVQFGAFFLAALLCHGRLAASRPPAESLTTFYLAMSAGGAVGGLVGAIAAPLLLPGLYEYPLAVVAGALLLPGAWIAGRRAWLRPAVAAMLMLALGGLGALVLLSGLNARLAEHEVIANSTEADVLRLLLLLWVPAIAAVAFSRRPPALAIVLAGIFALSLLPLGSTSGQLYRSRDFYGIHVVSAAARPPSSHVYENAGVVHGLQIETPALRDVPTAYYAPSGPLGDVFAALGRPDLSVAAVGLGAGDVACYRRPGQSWTFYEIDPQVVQIARDPRLFTFLGDCAPNAPIVLGDGRRELARAPAASFDLIVVDAFSGDAPPVHLLTREALALYESKLKSGGAVLFHISNSYVNFSPVLSSTGRAQGLVVYTRIDADVTPAEARAGKIESQWVAMARRPEDLAAVVSRAGWRSLTFSDPQLVWTDDYSNLLSVLRLT